MDVIAFHPKHLECISLRPEEKNTTFAMPDVYKYFENVAAASVQSYTFLEEGRVFFCAGFVLLWPGVMDFWMVPSAYVKTKPFTFYRTIRGYLKVIPETFKLHRIQTTSFCDEFHDKWMKKLGFEKEGTMRQYCMDKRDMAFYGRVF